MVPTCLGQPFYHQGFPVRSSDIYCNSTPLDAIKMKYLEHEATKEEEAELKEYVLYYAAAPCFNIEGYNDPEKNLLKEMPLDDLLDLLLDAGIDPL